MNEAIRKLLDQQSKVTERSPQWMVAEQLMDICRRAQDGELRLCDTGGGRPHPAGVLRPAGRRPG